MQLRKVLVLGLLVLATPLFAQEEEEGPWSGSARLGYLASSGNTDSSSLNSGFEIGYATGQWAHKFTAAAIHSAEDDETIAEAYEAAWKSERNFGESNYLFGQGDWRKDRFSGYDEQFSQTIGYGRRIIENERHTLNAEIGAGARQSDLADGTEESEAILRGGLAYKFQISETAEFTQEIAIEAGDENTYTESVSKVSAALVGNLALVASYTIKNNSDVPPLTEETDTFTAISLEYTF